mgnify:CR=1 FL=1
MYQAIASASALSGEFANGGTCGRPESSPFPCTLIFPSTSAHRIELVAGPVWTLFLTGPFRREWGFHCPQGWRHWRDFTSGANGERVGKGCD